MDSQRLDEAPSGMARSARMRRTLILGGTAEARALAGALAERRDLAVTLSLAGRTAEPLKQPVPVRSGGFGGAEGLADYLRAARIDVLIDATHPYAAAISANAAEAARAARIPLIALRRPPWTRVAGDMWTEAGTMEEAVTALGQAPRRVFLALGRKELHPFEAAPQHVYLVRSVDPVDPPLAVPHA
ncbi:MAG: precorrin-6A/cobalt-precorrin-6A reductase, partial [Candidatus Eiseniibacteriota bacterium]